MADDNDVPPPPAVPSEAAPTKLASQEILTVRDVPPPVAKEVPPPEVVAVVNTKNNLPQNLVLFNEESNGRADLSEPERRALGVLASRPPPSQWAEKAPVKIEEAAEKIEPNPLAELEICTQEESPKDENVKPTQNPTIESILKHESPAQDDWNIWGIPRLKDKRSESEIRALEELKQEVEKAIAICVVTSRPPLPPLPQLAPVKIEEAAKKTEPKPVAELESCTQEESAKDGNVKPKSLRVREFKVKDAFSMLKNALWRKEFGIEAVVDVDLGEHLDKVVYMHGFDREGHPVCYNVYGIRLLERSIRKLDLTPGGVNTIVQVHDLKNWFGTRKKELRQATKQALFLLMDNYPEFVAKQVFINVPWWYLAFYMMISPFLTQRTKSKFVFASPVKSAESLFKYISPEQVPIQYGGLSVVYGDCNPYFSISDPAKEFNMKPSTKIKLTIPFSKQCVIVWEVRVVGWEIIYRAEFIPDAKDEYTLIIQKAKKMSPTDDPVVRNSFKVKELGKMVVTIYNPTLKKKKLLYRFKVKPYTY